MRKLLVALIVFPALALAQGPKDKPQGQPGPDPARAEKRMKLARTLGLATALDLDAEQALKLGDVMSRFDDRRKALRQQIHDARDALRGAAQGGKTTAAEVDAAIAKALDARAQTQALDKEMLTAITKDLTPQQKARAALFLGSFRERIERHMMMMRGGHGPGMMHGPDDRGPGGRMGGEMMGPGGDHMAMMNDDDPPPFADDME